VRSLKYINRKIKELQLNLSGEIVLTELGNNNYIYTPLIAALAGAEKVIAWTANNNSFCVEENTRDFLALAKELGLENKITVRVNDRDANDIKAASIITNSGFVRPLDRSFLQNVNAKAVIPLMFEAWELRSSDIDIECAKEFNIKVAGTFENHPLLKVFDGVGPLAIKLCLEAGYEVYNNNILVYSDDNFGEVSKKAFEAFGANKVVMTTDIDEILLLAADTDFIYLCRYKENREFFSDELLEIPRLIAANSNIGIVHLYGAFNYKLLSKNNLAVYPQKDGKASIMSETLAYLGPQLIISLAAGGLKVAQLMRADRINDMVQPITY